jgi:hypothetical protein
VNSHSPYKSARARTRAGSISEHSAEALSRPVAGGWPWPSVRTTGYELRAAPGTTYLKCRKGKVKFCQYIQIRSCAVRT